MQLRLFLLASLLPVAVLGCRARQDYPDGPILLVCPWAVGGGTDRVSRQLALFLEEELEVPVNVINATGGSGVTGHSRGARARPDGYTLTTMTVELNMLHWRGLTEVSWQEFTPLMLINQDPAALFVRVEDTRWKDLHELSKDIRKAPRRLTASGTAAGGIWHLALAGWLHAVGLRPDAVRWIPMNGAGPSLQELVSGGLDLVACSLPEARTLLAAGQVRSLGVMAESRLPGYPDVPSFKEQGVDWVMGGWRGVGVPGNTPPKIVRRLVAALGEIVAGRTRVQGRSFPEFMAIEHFDFSWQYPDGFARTLERFDRNLGALLTSPEFASLQEGRFKPMAFPQLLLGLLAVTLLALLVSRLKRDSPPRPETVPGSGRQGTLNFLLTIGAVAFFVLSAEKLGFILTAFVLLLGLMWRLGTRLWVGLLIALLLTASIYELFVGLLRVPLPRGVLGW